MHEHDLTTHQSPLELLLLPKQEKGKDLKMQATEAALTAAAASVEVFFSLSSRKSSLLSNGALYFGIEPIQTLFYLRSISTLLLESCGAMC